MSYSQGQKWEPSLRKPGPCGDEDTGSEFNFIGKAFLSKTVYPGVSISYLDLCVMFFTFVLLREIIVHLSWNLL